MDMTNDGTDYSSQVVFSTGFKNGSVRFPQTKDRDMDEEEQIKEETFKEAFMELTQNISIHGLKEATEDQPFKFRRFFWALLVLGGLGAFCWQLVVSILLYLSHPSTVNIKINYNHTINFPAFTICNHNAFRMTKVAEMGDYDLISKVYEAEDNDIDWSKERSANLSMRSLYGRAAHDLKDLIVDCIWDGKPCSPGDFQTLPTDYGLCYSFNKDPDPLLRKRAMLTGVEGGLRLLLNIEQYEYMPGPNSAAGLKISLHNPNESPSVKDHGYAIPPGSHTLVAVKITETENLEHPYGKCDDSIELKHFNHYSVHNCEEECNINEQLEKCACVSISMPLNLENHSNCEDKVGKSGQNCSTPKPLNKAEEERCAYCPVPCNLLTYDATISYSSLSNFDLETLLRNDLVDTLENKNRYAREISEKVDSSKNETNTRLIKNLKETYDYLTSAFSKIRMELQGALEAIEVVHRSTLQHIKFHDDWGLYKVWYIQKYDFARGYDIRKERYFDFVCADYYSLRKRANSLFENLMNNTEASVSEAAWLSFESYLAGRQWLTNKCKEQLLDFNASYYTGDPLLTYRASPDRRYDMSWVALSLLRVMNDDQFRYVQYLVDAFDGADHSMTQFRRIGDEILRNHYYDVDSFNDASETLESACVTINFRLFLLVDRVVYNPVNMADEMKRDFIEANDTLLLRLNELQRTKNNIIELLDVIDSDYWPKFDLIVTDSLKYLENGEGLKTSMAEYLSSEEVNLMTQSLETVFSELRSRSRELLDNWDYLAHSLVDVWERMLNEKTTKNFYEMIYNDFQEYVTTPETKSKYISIFASLLKANETELGMTYPDWGLEDRLNANFHVMDISAKKSEVFTNISELIDKTNVVDYLNEKDDLFLSQLDDYRKNLINFLKGNEIDTKFFTDNFVRLDVFMQELSYEEIIQQRSYEILSVVGDVGGAMGLFGGGSLLTMIAVFDFFIHFWCKRIFME